MSKSVIQGWLSEFKCYTSDGKIVFCTYCNKEVSGKTKFQLQQHAKSALHEKNSQRKRSSVQTLLTNSNQSTEPQNKFVEDLCEALISSNIPLKKIENPKLRGFLENYCKRDIPSEATLRQKYVDVVYKKTVQNIKEDIGDNPIWIMADETSDGTGRFVANLIVGKLSSTEPGRPHLLSCKVLEKVNNETIARFINESLRILWPSGGNEEKVLLMVTDAAPYMMKAGKNLKIFYPNMLHISCLAHGIHRVAEEIRRQFPEVDNLINQSKKVFLKAPSRIAAYKEYAEDLPLPPQPVLTRWGTWITAALFYANHFDVMKSVIDSFEAESAHCVALAQNAFNNEGIKGDLAYIKAHFNDIPKTIEKLEANSLTLMSAVQKVENLRKIIAEVPGPKGRIVSEKFECVLDKNKSYQVLSEVNQVLEGKTNIIPANIKLTDVASYKYAPITSCDVERSFSSYKIIFTDRRYSLLPQNIEKLLVVYCNK